MKSSHASIRYLLVVAAFALGSSCTDEAMFLPDMTEITEAAKTCHQEETAWAAGTRFINPGNWATYTAVEGSEKTVKLLADQNTEAGAVRFSEAVDGEVTITITFNDGWSLQEGEETVKIQGYDSPPSGNPAPGLFRTYKGTDLTITVPAYDFYGVHVDVRKSVPCN